MAHYHTVVWIDHRAAHVYGFGRSGTSDDLVKSHGPRHIHRKAGPVGSGHEHNRPAYFREVAAHLGEAGTILIVGPAETKTELKCFLDLEAPAIAARVVGVEPLEQESEGRIIAVARKFFAASDRMAPQRR